MIPNIFTEYPSWFFLFCIILGTAYAGILYYHERRSDFSKTIKIVMAGLRFLAITILSFLLLSPFLKTVVRQKEKPIIIIAQDNSHSIFIGSDSTFYFNDYPISLDNLVKDLSGKYEVKFYSFGERTRLLGPEQPIKDFLSFNEKQTNISEFFN